MGNSQRKIPGRGLKKRRTTKRASKNTGQRVGMTGKMTRFQTRIVILVPCKGECSSQ